LAHQTRRAILSVLHANGGVMTSGAIAGRFACSWQTTSRHLRVLKEAGLVQALLRGRERVYQLDADWLRTLTIGWVGRFVDSMDE
jgi:DNA-binding transcriptional ArsR family regulator